MHVPWVNYLLLAANAGVFLYQLSLGPAVEALVRAHGFVPADLTAALATGEAEALVPVAQAALTSMFLHGGWLHVLGNLLYLRVFGDNVEDRFRPWGFVVFYVLGGFAGALGQAYVEPSSTVPMIGASGAIAAVLGAYIVLYPSTRVVTLFPVFIFLTFIEVPAVVFLGVWAGQQLLNGYLTISEVGSGDVAWFAHLGGFAWGVLAGLVYQVTLGRRRRAARRKG